MPETTAEAEGQRRSSCGDAELRSGREQKDTTWVSNPNALVFIQTRVQPVSGDALTPRARASG